MVYRSGEVASVDRTCDAAAWRCGLEMAVSVCRTLLLLLFYGCLVLFGLTCLTLLSDLCCLEETTATVVYSDSFLPTTAVAIQFLLLPGQKK